MGKLVDYSAKGGIAVLELNDPPANAYGYEMMRDLDEAILEARMDQNVHCLILRGKGEKFFLEQTFGDMSSLRVELVKIDTTQGTRFEKKEGSTSGDYYLINPQGDLEQWDNEGLFGALGAIR